MDMDISLDIHVKSVGYGHGHGCEISYPRQPWYLGAITIKRHSSAGDMGLQSSHGSWNPGYTSAQRRLSHRQNFHHFKIEN